MKEQNNPEQLTVVLDVVRVKASTVEKGDVDTSAIDFLLWAGFQSLKTAKNGDRHIEAEATENYCFALEYDACEVSSAQFRLVRINQGTRSLIDSGYTYYIQQEPYADGTIEIYAVGKGIKDWMIVCKKTSQRQATPPADEGQQNDNAWQTEMANQSHEPL